MTSSQYASHVYFRQKQSLRAKQKNKEESGTQTGVSAVNTSLLLRKACAVRKVTKFLKNYLKDKNASQNQAVPNGLPGKTSITCFIITP